MEQQNLGGTRHLDDIIYKRIINQFNYYTDGEIEITQKTKMNEILVCFMHNSDVIALWISDIPVFSIVSLLKFNNDQTGYISKTIE
jgi:hypothetical protein